MRQLTKEVYEAPLTTKRVVTMESSCMAASGEEMKESTMTISTTGQKDAGIEGTFDFSSNPWE